MGLVDKRFLAVLVLAAIVLLSGCTTGESQGTETRTETRSDASITIKGGDRVVQSPEQGQAEVRLDVSTSGNISEINWEAIQSPSGGSVGILDYNSYAELRIGGKGNYTIQVTGFTDNGETVQDTIDITVK